MGLKSHPHVTGLDWELPLDLPNLKMDGFPNSESPNLQGAIFRRTTDVKRWGWVTNPNVKYMAITVPKRFFVNTWLTNKPIAWIYMAKIPVPHLLVYPACRSFQKKTLSVIKIRHFAPTIPLKKNNNKSGWWFQPI